MTAPLDPAADAAVQAQLAAQAQAVTGTPSAGIFGDVAGAAQPPQQIDLSAAAPTVVTQDELAALLARVQKMEADREAERVAALPVPDEPPDKTPRLSNASGELHAAFAGVHARLLLVEEKLGL